MERRVVVTGLGAVTPLGIDVDTVWGKLCHGVSGIGRISRFDPTAYPAQIAGEVRGFTPELYLDKRDLRRTDRFVHFALFDATFTDPIAYARDAAVAIIFAAAGFRATRRWQMAHQYGFLGTPPLAAASDAASSA